MKKATKLFSLVCLVLLTCALLLSACDNGQTPSNNDGGDQNPPAHTHAFGEWTTEKEATCAENGEQKRVCSCGETETRPLAATGKHDYDMEITTEPTCTEEGVITSTCSVCGDSFTENTPPQHKFPLTNYGGLANCEICGAPQIPG